jgi:hypothetical protein
MDLDLTAFSLGFNDLLNEKKGSFNSYVDHLANENILPSFTGQKNWKYVVTPEGLRLSDGNHVYGFGLSDFGGELKPVEKLKDINILDFEKAKLHGGTAQIHRSSPHSIYMTLATGKDNPTFVLEHNEGRNWKYLPSKKMMKRLEAFKNQDSQIIPKVDPEALLRGGEEEIKTAEFNGVFGTPENAAHLMFGGINNVRGAMGSLAAHPLLTIGGTVLGGMLLNHLRKKLSPEYNQKMQTSPGKEFNRSIGLPLLAGGALVGLGGLMR